MSRRRRFVAHHPGNGRWDRLKRSWKWQGRRKLLELNGLGGWRLSMPHLLVSQEISAPSPGEHQQSQDDAGNQVTGPGCHLILSCCRCWSGCSPTTLSLKRLDSLFKVLHLSPAYLELASYKRHPKKKNAF